MNVRIVRHTLVSHDAIWIPERRLVLVDRGLSEVRMRAVLAHEAVHAECDDPGGHHPRNESRADLRSAQRLIDPQEWRALTASLEDYDRICIELGITRAQFRAFQAAEQRSRQVDRIERIGDCVYVNPKMGAGQWSLKVQSG